MNTDYQQPRLDPAKGTQLFRSGFTLIELLVVLAIIGILMAIVVGAIRGANQDTLVSKTRGTIAKIDSILNDRYDEYLSVPLNYLGTGQVGIFWRVDSFPSEFRRASTDMQQVGDGLWPVTAVRVNAGASPRSLLSTQVPPASLLRERMRVASTRDLMRMEMPDCPGDLAISPGVVRGGAGLATGFLYRTFDSSNNLTFSGPVIMQLSNSGRLERIVTRVSQARDTLGNIIWANQNANEELLYLIVEDSILNGSSAIEAFGNSEIADTDGDGLFEFIDAWGVPIRWLRWPAGYASVARTNPDPLQFPAQPTDPLDPTQADIGYDPRNNSAAATDPPVYPFAPGNAPRPLVMSAGQDGLFGVRFYITTSPFDTVGSASYGATTPLRAPNYFSTGFSWPDPYYPRDLVANRLGAPIFSGKEMLGYDFVNSTVTDGGDLLPTSSNDNVSNVDESGASL